MGRKRIHLVGKKFNMLKILRFDSKIGKYFYYLCECDCGNKKVIIGNKVKYGETKSCGCLSFKHNLKHGNAKRSFKNKATRTYTSWSAIKSRCLNKNNEAYHHYGGRGITMCKRWDKFENFLLDMGKCPDGLSIDRINTNGNYKPSNCRWATRKQQSVNRRGKIKGSSKFKGVVKFKDKWRARITIDKKLTCLGLYFDEKEAAAAYNHASVQVWGLDAYQNKL